MDKHVEDHQRRRLIGGGKEPSARRVALLLVHRVVLGIELLGDNVDSRALTDAVSDHDIPQLIALMMNFEW